MPGLLIAGTPRPRIPPADHHPHVDGSPALPARTAPADRTAAHTA